VARLERARARRTQLVDEQLDRTPADAGALVLHADH